MTKREPLISPLLAAAPMQMTVRQTQRRLAVLRRLNRHLPPARQLRCNYSSPRRLPRAVPDALAISAPEPGRLASVRSLRRALQPAALSCRVHGRAAAHDSLL